MTTSAQRPTADGSEDDAALRARIVDAAIDLGERRGWSAVHLHDVAEALGVGLADIRRHFEHQDALVEAWFDRADAALLACAATSGWETLPPRERLRRSIAAWLGALEPHRRLAAAMLRYKLQPEHLHLQALGALRVSRTVQWIREAARLTTQGLQREVEEAALTAIYLAVFARWLGDDSPGGANALRLLDRLLALAERAALRLAPSRAPWTG